MAQEKKLEQLVTTSNDKPGVQGTSIYVCGHDYCYGERSWGRPIDQKLDKLSGTEGVVVINQYSCVKSCRVGVRVELADGTILTYKDALDFVLQSSIKD